uniref:Amino acid transporter transmembrane domain-containing protein n=1 Tax=Salix viminalis TaxID=40686 RepID=A0A6N2LRS7_SALVM
MECLKAKEVESLSQLPQPEEPRRGTTFLKTCFNGLNALSGVGILSIPYALSQGGWLSLILLLSSGGSMLVYRVTSKTLSYPDIGEKAFGYKGRVVVSIFMYLELYLASNFAGLYIGGKTAFVLLTALVILPTTWLKSLGMLAYVSAGGVSASIILVGCVLWVGAVDGVGFHEDGVLLNWGGLPTTLSLFTFCYCGHAVFPTLCNSMKDRSQFSKVGTYAETGLTCQLRYKHRSLMDQWQFLGYLMYGEYLKSQVTLNLPIRKIGSKLAIYTTLVNPLTKYAGHHCSNCYCYRGDFCFPRQQISQHPRQDSDCDQHRGGGSGNSLFRIRDGFYRAGVHRGNPDDRVFCGYNRYIYFNQTDRNASLKLKDGAIKLTDNKIISSNAPSVSKPTSTYARQLFETISQPEIALFNSYVWRHSRSTAPLKAISIFIGALKHNLLPGDYSFPSLLETCARAFDKILEPCAVISGYARSSRPNEALSLFRQLQARGPKTNDVTVLSVLSSCVFGAHEYKRYTGLVCDDCGICNTGPGAKGDIYVQGNDE